MNLLVCVIGPLKLLLSDAFGVDPIDPFSGVNPIKQASDQNISPEDGGLLPEVLVSRKKLIHEVSGKDSELEKT